MLQTVVDLSCYIHPLPLSHVFPCVSLIPIPYSKSSTQVILNDEALRV